MLRKNVDEMKKLSSELHEKSIEVLSMTNQEDCKRPVGTLKVSARA